MATVTIPKIYEQEVNAVISAGYYSNISELIRDALRNFFELKPQLKVVAAIELYRKGNITLSKAAEISGMSIAEFEDVLINKGIKVKVPIQGKTEITRGSDIIRAAKNRK